MKKIDMLRYYLFINLCVGLMLVFVGCVSTQKAIAFNQNNANNVFLSNDLFVYGQDTLCVVHKTYRDCWRTENYANTTKMLRAAGDTIPPYLWDRVMYERIQYIGLSDDTRTMIINSGGLEGLLHSLLSEPNYANTIRNGKPEFVVSFIVSLADMKILEYGFELSWNDKNKQLTPTEMKNLLDFIHTIQLTYNGGEKFRNETIIFSMNLHRLK